MAVSPLWLIKDQVRLLGNRSEGGSRVLRVVSCSDIDRNTRIPTNQSIVVFRLVSPCYDMFLVLVTFVHDRRRAYRIRVIKVVSEVAFMYPPMSWLRMLSSSVFVVKLRVSTRTLIHFPFTPLKYKHPCDILTKRSWRKGKWRHMLST